MITLLSIVMLCVHAASQAAILGRKDADKTAKLDQDVLTDVASQPADEKGPVPLALFYLICATILLAICALVYMAFSEIKSPKKHQELKAARQY